VGGHLLNALIESPEYTRIYALTRRPLGREHPKLANRIVVFRRLIDQLKGLAVQDAFCCIGTTIAEAGSQEAFREADVEAVLQFAQAARACGATRFVVVSSAGADLNSKKFYLRTKAEMEEAVTAVGFPALDILQPGLLSGERKTARPLEVMGTLIAPLVSPFLTGAREVWRPIPAEKVARAMVGAARRGARGIYRHTYASIQQLAQSKPVQPQAKAAPGSGPA